MSEESIIEEFVDLFNDIRKEAKTEEEKELLFCVLSEFLQQIQDDLDVYDDYYDC